MSHIAREIASQPECWSRAAELSTTTEVAAALPAVGERVAVVGCGTSLYMAQACAVLRESAKAGETDAFAASEFIHSRKYDRVVALTRSGTTSEVIELLDRLPDGSMTTVLTTDAALPAAQMASHSITLDFANEQSVVQTRFATTALALWRQAMTGDLGTAVPDAIEAIAAGTNAQFLDRSQFTFLGAGWTVGLASEAALKVREAAQGWAESYPAMEFRHGPISVVDERSIVWSFGDLPVGLNDEIAATGALLVDRAVDPMADLVGAQLFAAALAEAKGLDPDRPRGLTRSIVLEPRP